MIQVKLSKKIRDLRYAKGWGPDELADRAKISRTALYQIERGGTSKPQAGTLRRISRALGVPLEALVAAVETAEEGDSAFSEHAPAVARASRSVPTSVASSQRADELIEKFRVLLASPLAEGVARIVEESFRLLPIIPASVVLNQPRYATSVEFESVREARSQPFKHA
jgi:transcriptional regulator with XRE-family HTH domain